MENDRKWRHEDDRDACDCDGRWHDDGPWSWPRAFASAIATIASVCLVAILCGGWKPWE